MSDITDNTTDTEETPSGAAKEYSGRKIMCFVSKRMVHIEDTVEVQYAPGKSYRILEKFIRFNQDAN